MILTNKHLKFINIWAILRGQYSSGLQLQRSIRWIHCLNQCHTEYKAVFLHKEDMKSGDVFNHVAHFIWLRLRPKIVVHICGLGMTWIDLNIYMLDKLTGEPVSEFPPWGIDGLCSFRNMEIDFVIPSLHPCPKHDCSRKTRKSWGWCCQVHIHVTLTQRARWPFHLFIRTLCRPFSPSQSSLLIKKKDNHGIFQIHHHVCCSCGFLRRCDQGTIDHEQGE